MTPRELRLIAERVDNEATRLACESGLKCAGEYTLDCIQLALHILETVREDDDEPVTKSWLMEFDAYGFMELDGAMWCILTDSYLPVDMTRGQFRSLCLGLGLELKEEA